MGFLSVNEQMDLIRRGAEEIIPEEELVRKLERSQSKNIPLMPIKADLLMSKYNLSAGRSLGNKLMLIEKEWVENNFKITDHQVENIINN